MRKKPIAIACAIVSLLGASVVGYAQEAKFAAVPTKAPVKQVHVVRPASEFPHSSQLRGRFARRAAVRKNLTPVNTGSGLVFTCDPNVTPATCSYLNTTVAGYYNSTFTNANANIYIRYGATGLGSSEQYLNFVSYNNYVAALNANSNKSAIQTSALSALGTYDATPYGSGNVNLTAALGATLGFTGLFGIQPNGNFCTPGTAGCYNAIITITNDPGTPLYYDNLGGPEPADAYDFYTTVSHEVDEVLGSSSCISTQGGSGLTDGCGGSIPSAVDLFRYSGDGDLVLDSTLNPAAGAYFSYDGGATNDANGRAGTPKVYNTLANGDDYADFLSSSPDCGTDQAVQDAEGCPGEDQGLTILNDGGGEINILNAVGYDVPAPAAVSLSTSNINFGSWGVDIVSTAQPVTITNNGTTTLHLTSVTLTGANASSFLLRGGCGSTIAPSASCTYKVYFYPQAPGTDSASLNFNDSASGSPQSVSLAGTSAASAVSFSTSSLTFAAQTVNTISAAQTIKVSNTGAGTLEVTGVGVTGANPSSFLIGGGCGSTIAAGGSCNYTVRFKPTAAGPASASFNISDNASGSPQSVTLSGIGGASGASLSTSNINFGSWGVNIVSTAQPVTLTNNGTLTLHLASVTLTGANASSFLLRGGCGATIAPSAACTYSVYFFPQAPGTDSASLNFNDDASGSPQSVSLAGTSAASGVSLSTSSLTFAAQTVNTTSAFQTVVLTNTGAGTLHFTSIGLTGANAASFIVGGGCGATIAAGKSCNYSVRFKPSTTGPASASFNFTDNASGSPQSVTLSGTGK